MRLPALLLAVLAGGVDGPPAPEAVARAIGAAVGYLCRASGEEGRWTYRAFLDARPADRERYNVLRHAGTMHALAEAAERGVDACAGPTLERASRHLATFVRPVPGHPDLLAVWSAHEPPGAPEAAKLGGAGLALAAEVEASAVLARDPDVPRLTRLADFVLFLQAPDGRFRSKWVPGAEDDGWESLYYPGEAALGLLLLHRVAPEPRFLDGARRALLSLARRREGLETLPADHWALLATRELLGRDRAALWAEERRALLHHAARVSQSILAAPGVGGALTRDGRVAPTATRLEGLLAACETLSGPEHAALRARITEAADAGVGFLLGAQVRAGPLAGGFPRGPAWSHGLFSQEVRIDTVQHALSALLAWERTRKRP